MALLSLTRCSLLGVFIAGLLAYIGALLPTPPAPRDPDVAALSEKFAAAIGNGDGLSVGSKGFFLRDRDTLFWKLFTDLFGANPNTPYMWSTLPLIGFLLPSPMWSLGAHDAVVLLSRVPPKVDYFSFTTFALFMPRRNKPILPFASLGDSVNNKNIKHHDGLFAHVVTANARTFELIKAALKEAGLPASAINLRPVPSELGLFDDALHLGGQARLGTHFEVVLRLFRFHNQTEGDAYLRSAPPVFYLTGTHGEEAALPDAREPSYQERRHPDSVQEAPLRADFDQHGLTVLAQAGAALNRGGLEALQAVEFAPLMIKGLECLAKDTECLGDCPDAAYFGPHVREDTDDIQMLRLEGEYQAHIVTAVNHRLLNASIYGSVALLKPQPVSAPVLSKARMSVRATPIGVTSFEFDSPRTFVSWAFTRSAEICAKLTKASAVDGCSVVEASHVVEEGFLTYCERVYLNPLTGLGPHWDDLLPARLYHIDLGQHPLIVRPTAPRGLPPPLPLAKITDGSETMRFFHIIKTGGESLELHLAKQPAPRLDYSHCRRAGMSSGWRGNLTAGASGTCAAAAAAVSAVLCGANCECCADDVRVDGGFNGILIRSPRAHMLSLFSHCHTAHTKNSWGRILDDVPQYLAEVVLRSTERACGSYCGLSFQPEWADALAEALAGDPRQERTLRVLPLRDTQSHALTCSTRRGSLGQHFRVLDGPHPAGPGDTVPPPLEAALATLHRFEWVGLTDLFDHSLCLLHYQANGSLPLACSCQTGRLSLGLPRFNHGVKRTDPSSLSPSVLAKIDEHTETDSKVFAAALRLLLGRLRTVEEATGTDMLSCLNWRKLYTATSHITGLWASPDEFIA